MHYKSYKEVSIPLFNGINTKITRIMKLATLALILCVNSLFATNALSQRAKVTITSRTKTTQQLLQEIEKQTNYLFVFSEKEVNLNRNVHLEANDETVAEVLNEAFKGTNIQYAMEGNNIMLMKKNKQAKNVAQKPTQQIKGTIIDKDGMPIIGANVMIKGTSNGTITDLDGKFVLSCSPNDKLEISYIGYSNQLITVGNKGTFNITLKEDTQALDEVVVVGYGTQKKVNLTGAVETVDSETIENRPIKSAADALQGNALGVSVSSATGQPGEFSSIKVRGETSLNSDGALVLIDGMPGQINDVNPQDIENISVLKDAASSAIYGARAAEGVILITTKQGNSEKTKVEYSGNISFNTPTRIPQSTDALTHAELSNLAFTNAGSAPLFPDNVIEAIKDPSIVSVPNKNDFYYTGDMDWIDLMMDHSFQENHNITISRKQKALKYRFSAGWLDQNGLFAEYGPDNYDRYNLRSNVNFQMIKDILNFDSRISFTRSEKRYHPKYGNWSIPYITFIQSGPNMPIYDQNGNYSRYRMQGNPIQALREGGEGKKVSNTTEGIFTLNYTPQYLKGLSLKAIGGSRFINQSTKEWRRQYGKYGPDGLRVLTAGQKGPNSIKAYKNNTQYFTGQLLAEYKNTFGDHEVGGLGGWSAETQHYHNIDAYRMNIIGNELPALDLGSTNGWKNNEDEYEWSMLSYFFRLNYAYKAKYLFEANFRADGSSRFSDKNKWGYFPSFSAGWRLTEEDFMKDQKIFDNIKIRASWGQLGNQNGLGLYDHIPTYNVSGYYSFENELAQWATLAMLPSQDRTWETVEMTNIAVDLGFLNNRLTATAEYYVKRNKDMLVNIDVSDMVGIKVPTGNYGELKVNGWEASIGWQDQKDDYSYFVRFNLSDYKDKLVDYGVDFTGFTAGVNQKIEGYSVGSIFGFKTDGYFQTTEEAKAAPAYNRGIQDAGDIKYVDLDGDGKISAPNDLAYLGTTTPRYEFGISLGGSYKDFDISLLFQGVAKRNFYMQGEAFQPFRDTWSNYSYTYFTDYWTPENPNALLPRLYAGVKHNYAYSSHWLQNAAYLRLKNLQLGYTLPTEWANKILLTKLRIYFSGENLFELSKLFKDYDPELNDAGGYMYPIMRNYSLGINVTF